MNVNTSVWLSVYMVSFQSVLWL